jgi:hypothetical protein
MGAKAQPKTGGRKAGTPNKIQSALFVRLWAAAHGIEITGTINNYTRRPEVQGMPIPRHHVGPIGWARCATRFANETPALPRHRHDRSCLAALAQR